MKPSKHAEAIRACRELPAEAAHAARCALLVRIAQARRNDAKREVVALLREVEMPLPVEIACAVAALFDPDAPARKSGPKYDRLAELSKRWDAAEAMGEAWAKGATSQEDALEDAAEALGVSARTVWNLTRGPFLRVVECARIGGNLTDEECNSINCEFWTKFCQRRKV